MKRILCLLLTLCLLPLSALSLAEEAEARELQVEYHNAADKVIDGTVLTDGDDETGVFLKKDKQGSLIVVTGEGDICEALYLRLSAAPDRVELQLMGDRRWDSLMTVADPGTEFFVKTGPIAGKVKIILYFDTAAACNVMELRAFAGGAFPEELHDW